MMELEMEGSTLSDLDGQNQKLRTRIKLGLMGSLTILILLLLLRTLELCLDR